jgi:hypothetical protein
MGRNTAKKKEYDKIYALKYKEKRSAYNKDYRDKNKEKLTLLHEEYRKEHLKDYSENSKEWRKRNPDKYAEHQFKSNLKRLYGITPEQYYELYYLQDGNCAICGEHQSNLKKTLCVDHVHETGEIRGLLCHACNMAIGLLKDNPIIALNAYKYLAKGTND